MSLRQIQFGNITEDHGPHVVLLAVHDASIEDFKQKYKRQYRELLANCNENEAEIIKLSKLERDDFSLDASIGIATELRKMLKWVRVEILVIEDFFRTGIDMNRSEDLALWPYVKYQNAPGLRKWFMKKYKELREEIRKRLEEISKNDSVNSQMKGGPIVGDIHSLDAHFQAVPMMITPDNIRTYISTRTLKLGKPRISDLVTRWTTGRKFGDQEIADAIHEEMDEVDFSASYKASKKMLSHEWEAMFASYFVLDFSKNLGSLYRANESAYKPELLLPDKERLRQKVSLPVARALKKILERRRINAEDSGRLILPKEKKLHLPR